jgi:hypothetical protein
MEVARAQKDKPSMKPADAKNCSARCAAGDHGGCVALGLLHLEGGLAKKDAGRAAKLFEGACTGGYAPGRRPSGGWGIADPPTRNPEQPVFFRNRSLDRMRAPGSGNSQGSRG